MRRSLVLAAIAATVALGACGPVSNESDPIVPDETRAPTPATETPDTETPAPATETPDTDAPDTATPAETTNQDPSNTETEDALSTPDRLGLLAATDLAGRLGLDVDDIEVVDVEEVTWRDGSFGCPQKDFQYAQVLTPGIRIALSAEGSTYAYHAGPGRDPFYCIDPQTPV